MLIPAEQCTVGDALQRAANHFKTSQHQAPDQYSSANTETVTALRLGLYGAGQIPTFFIWHDVVNPSPIRTSANHRWLDQRTARGNSTTVEMWGQPCPAE
jgi:hypothetical protein